MNKIKLLLLEGCQRCQRLKEELDKNKMDYEYEVCKSDTKICDDIEDLIGCSNYPIVLKVNSFSRLIEEVGYITDNYNHIGKKIIDNEIVKVPIYSIDQLIDYANNK